MLSGDETVYKFAPSWLCVSKTNYTIPKCKLFEQLNHVLYIEEGIDQDEAAALKMNSTLSFEEKNENVGESKKIIYWVWI